MSGYKFIYWENLVKEGYEFAIPKECLPCFKPSLSFHLADTCFIWCLLLKQTSSFHIEAGRIP